MDVISFCIIPGKKAAVFKDILSPLHITLKSEFLFQRLHLSILCTLLTDWSFSLSAFDNVEAQGESNLITIRFSFSNQVKKKM